MTEQDILPSSLSSDAVATADAIRAGQTTTGDEIARIAARIERANPLLNFLAFNNLERASNEPATSATGPLAGVPTLIKDHVDEQGTPNTFGSFALRNNIAKEDGPLVRAMRQSGLVIVGRSTMPELGANATTESQLTGITRNPWSLEHSPGGSSGGAGAAVASGAVTIAHASDGLGSIRHGAGPCGLVGLKASRGRVAGEEGFHSFTDLGVNGCVSRTVRDTVAWLEATEYRGSDRRYPTIGSLEIENGWRLRVLSIPHVMRTGDYPSDAVMDVLQFATSLLQKLGHVILDGTLPFDGSGAIAALRKYWAGSTAKRSSLYGGGADVDKFESNLEFRTRTMIATGRLVSDDELARQTSVLTSSARSYLGLFEQADIVMKPTFGREIARVEQFSFTGDFNEQYEDLLDYAGYSWVDNVAGTPAISLPIGFDRDGLPVGIQFAAEVGQESALLMLAFQLEQELVWWNRKPPIWVRD